MEKIGLTRDDLATFGIESAPAREQAIALRLKPRLEAMALRFAAPLSKFAGRPLSAALELPQGGLAGAAGVLFFTSGEPACSSPQFRFALSRGGAHARLVIEREAPGRQALAKKLAKSATALARELSGTDLRSYDGWDGRGLPAPASANEAPFWREVAERLGREAGRLDLGVGWPEARAVLLSYEDLLPAWRSLVPLYKRLV